MPDQPVDKAIAAARASLAMTWTAHTRLAPYLHGIADGLAELPTVTSGEQADAIVGPWEVVVVSTGLKRVTLEQAMCFESGGIIWVVRDPRTPEDEDTLAYVRGFDGCDSEEEVYAAYHRAEAMAFGLNLTSAANGLTAEVAP